MFRLSKSVLLLAAAVSVTLLVTMCEASGCNPACKADTECCVQGNQWGFRDFSSDGNSQYHCVPKPGLGQMCGASNPCVGSGEGDVCTAGLKCHAAKKECVTMETDDTCTACGQPYGSKGPCCGSGVRGHNNECFCT